MASEADSARPNAYEASAAARTTARFQVIRVVGEGGMATVYEVLDASTGKRVALKRLHAQGDPKHQRHAVELFEHEFYTLSQIAHPHIVEAYDYGIDDQGAYYTMELLGGGELQRLAPLPFARVCRIGRDICSALSLLHSRRLVFRDLSPRNVHCAQAGPAKLIDFGTTMRMGFARQVVGTPACCAPEAIDLQPLDGRADLYSLGATLYFTLTGRHAYPARTFAQLRGLLNERPQRPSDIVADVPAALETLILELLHVEPALRPADASEVMEQLAAIEGRPIEETLQVSRAYLSTPTLVGHDANLRRIRGKLQRAARGQGAALLIDGAAGVGRTRLLAASLLDATILGTLALRADAGDGREDYSVARGLALGLLERAPELTHKNAASVLPVVGHIVPELLVDAPPLELREFDDPTQRRAALVAALREWFLSIARERPLLIAIDDLHEIDEPSAALVALCAHDASKHALSVIATCETESLANAPSALKLFASAASALHVDNLSEQHSEELLRSVFGAVPRVHTVAHELHSISQGNPRDTLQLAQYLVDKGLAQYRSGAWSLPAAFDASDLPPNMADALRGHVEALGLHALEFGRLISLADDRAIGIGECLAAQPDFTPKQVHDSLEQLEKDQIVERSGDRFSISQRGFHAALRHALPQAASVRLHRTLAELFARRGDEEFRRGKHLLRAGDAAAALDVLCAWSSESQTTTDPNPLEYLKLVASMPEDWLGIFTSAIALCEQLERPVSQRVSLRSRLSTLIEIMRVPAAVGHPVLMALLQQLSCDSGVEAYARLAPTLPAAERLQRSLELAVAGHRQSPERALDPKWAFRQLVRTQFLAGSTAVIELDLPFWSELPSLAAFAPLSPAVAVIDKFIAAVGARLRGRPEHMSQLYRELVERLDQPDRAGMDQSYHRFLRYGLVCALGVVEASMGRSSCLGLADELEVEPLYRVNALRIRMLHHLWQGRAREADVVRDRAELLRIESCPRTLQDGTHLLFQTVAHALGDDLTRLKQVIDEIEGLSTWRPAWRPVVHYAHGEYQRIRGDHESALPQLESALSATQAGTHPVWAFAAGSYTSILRALGRIEEAVAFANEAVSAAERAELGHAINFIRTPLALALADQGAFERAAALADEVIERVLTRESEGLSLVSAYETRAQIAIAAQDNVAYAEFVRRGLDHCREIESPTLRRRCERLERVARRAALHVSHEVVDLSSSVPGTAQLTSLFRNCTGRRERGERMLQLLLRGSGAQSGFLYLIGQHGPGLVAQAGPREPPAGLETSVREFIDAELYENELNTATMGFEAENRGNSIWPGASEGLYRLVLLCHQLPEGLAITGVAALLMSRDSQFSHPAPLANRLSQLSYDAGDPVPAISAWRSARKDH